MSEYNIKLAESLYQNLQRFWAAVKHSTEHRKNINFLKTEDSFTTDKLKMASTLNTFFHSVFNPKNLEPFTQSPISSTSSMPELSIYNCQRLKLLVLRNLNPYKACGPDNNPNRLLIELADVIAHSLCEIFNISLALGVVPLQ